MKCGTMFIQLNVYVQSIIRRIDLACFVFPSITAGKYCGTIP